MSGDRWRDAALLCVCLAVLAVVVHAGLRPYDFRRPNDAAWTDAGPGLDFGRHGIAATRANPNQASVDEPAPFSMEVWLRRGASPPADGGAVVSVADGEAVAPLLLAQWRGTFYFRFPALQDGRLAEQTLSLGGDFPEGGQRFVALSTGPAGSRAYLGSVAVGRPLEAQPLVWAGDGLAGRLVLGNQLHAGRGWIGRVEGLALYRRQLSPAELAAHAASARREGIASLVGQPGLVGLYAFDEGQGARVRDLAGGVGDLAIPVRCVPLAPQFLRWRAPLPGYPVPPRDVGLNILGFVPVGLLLFVALRRFTALDATWVICLATLVGFSLSLAIETSQALLPSRVSTATDLLLNAAGSALGALSVGVLARHGGGP